MTEKTSLQPTFEDLELLARVSQLLMSLDLDEVLRQVIALMRDAVGATWVSFFLHDQHGLDWDHILMVRELPPGESLQVVHQVLDNGLAGWATRHRQGTLVQDTQTDPRWYVFPGDQRPVRSVLCVPFLYEDQVIAVLTLEHEAPQHFNEYHLRMMTIVANQASVAVRNAQLFQRLEGQQRQLRAVLQAIPEVLIVLDHEQRILLLNNAAQEMLQVAQASAAIGSTLHDYASLDPIFYELHTQVMEHQRAAKSFQLRSEAFQRDFEVTLSVWHHAAAAEGNAPVAGHIVLLHDITTLHDLSRFKDEMLRIASHDLRSPIALIIGYADMIEMDDTGRESPVRDYVNIIQTAAERMNNMLEELLRVERVKTSPLELYETITIKLLVETTLENMRPAATQKHLIYGADIQLDETLILVLDPVLIRQAMENLIGNAIKYTPEGKTVRVLAYTTATSFEFIVEDSGIGIDKAHLPNLFRSFYRVKNQQTSGIAGSGLGLSLVKSVVERHRGEVWVESEPGVGSRFGFRLPLS